MQQALEEEETSEARVTRQVFLEDSPGGGYARQGTAQQRKRG